MIRIRLATEEDKETIASLQTESWRDVYQTVLPGDYLSGELETELADHWCKQEIKPADLVMLAELANRAVGFIAVWCRPHAFIDNFHVAPNFRCRGIGSNLLGVATTSLMVRGHREASLWVFESNEAAIRFYLRCGAEIVDRQQKSFFNYPVPSLQLHWRDISTILESVALNREIQRG